MTQTIKGDIMKTIINTLCFIFLFLFLISAVSAAEWGNETETPLGACEDDVMTSSEPQKVTISAPNVNMYYNDGHKFSVTVKNKDKAINKAKVKITLNNETYEKTTDKKGTASVGLKLKAGNYSVLTVFSKTSKYKSAKKKSTVVIKSTIKNKDLTKYYKNTGKYSSKFYDLKGKPLKNTKVKFKLDGKTTKVKTNGKGIAELSVDLKPGSYKITATNPKSGESVKKTIIIKSLIITDDLEMTYGDGSRFKVKILDSNGKAAAKKKVTVNVNGKSYTKTTDKKGVVNFDIDLKSGNYTLTTAYDDLKVKNKIIVNSVKNTSFTHVIQVPGYVNVTNIYVYPNTAYAVKTGPDGIIRMPKQMIFTIQTESKTYQFTTSHIQGVDSTVIGYKHHLIPFDGGEIKSDIDRSKLRGNGIIISSTTDYTQIEYQSTAESNAELFGFYADKGFQNSETVTYIQNNMIKAKVNIQTTGFDELGVKMNLAKIYGASIYDFYYKTYSEITYGNEKSITFTNTKDPVTFNYFGNGIVGYITKENIMTRMIVDGKTELEKIESISYGLEERYRNSMGFEVLQSYAIINDKVNDNVMDQWLLKKSGYLSRSEKGIGNVYGMFLISLETAWRADELANSLAKEMNVKWSRADATTVLSGINLDNTYIHILNSDMGMDVNADDKTNVTLFRLINSLALPEIEEESLSPINKTFEFDSKNSLSDLVNSDSHEIAFINDIIYIHGANSTLILNETTGIATVLLNDSGFYYKGSTVKTTDDCCICSMLPRIISDLLVNPVLKSKVIDPLTERLYAVTKLAYTLFSTAIKYRLFELTALGSLTFATVVACLNIQDAGVIVRNNEEEKNWHTLMDIVTFTRPGYLQGKKVYNYPNKNGGYDYIEVPVKSDLTLDRTNAQYISKGKVKQLTKKETYKYFEEETWTPINLPTKYWDKSWNEVLECD